MVLLLYAALIGGITWLAIKGYAYRGVYVVLVPLGIGWLVVFGMAANWSGVTLENPEARNLGMLIAIAGAAVAAGGFFGAILFHKHDIESTGPVPEQGDLKKCPDCAELVKKKARKCRFCGFAFPEEALPAQTDLDQSKSGGEVACLRLPLNSEESDSESEQSLPATRAKFTKRDTIILLAMLLLIVGAAASAYWAWNAQNGKSNANSTVGEEALQDATQTDTRHATTTDAEWAREHAMAGIVRASTLGVFARGNSNERRKTRFHLVENVTDRGGFVLMVDPNGPCGGKLPSGVGVTYHSDTGFLTLEGGELCDLNVNIDATYEGVFKPPAFQTMVLKAQGLWIDN